MATSNGYVRLPTVRARVWSPLGYSTRLFPPQLAIQMLPSPSGFTPCGQLRGPSL